MKWASALILATICLASAARSEEPTSLVIDGISTTAVCRDATGKKIVPDLRPTPPFRAKMADNERIVSLVGKKDCFLNASEYHLESDYSDQCSSAKSDIGDGRYVGTRGLVAPHCDQ